MDDVKIVSADESDSGWERDSPRFRVYLQRATGSFIGGWTDSYDIVGADVVQVIDWAQRRAGGSLVYSVALVYDDEAEERRNPGYGRGLVWLVGMDGNQDELDPAEAEIQKRMLARRRKPIVVPPSDRMPDALRSGNGDTESG